MGTAKNAVLAALRDFFLARTADDLAAACGVLANTPPETKSIEALGCMDWEEAVFAFNKLFVGPMALQAPPYASCYLDPEPLLMGETTLRVRRLYEMAGLVSPLQGSLPDDHLGVELDAALAMIAMAGRFDAQEPRDLWRYFLHEHMAVWLPQFLDRARKAETRHPAVDLALDRLQGWLDDQRTEQEGYDQ